MGLQLTLQLLCRVIALSDCPREADLPLPIVVGDDSSRHASPKLSVEIEAPRWLLALPASKPPSVFAALSASVVTCSVPIDQAFHGMRALLLHCVHQGCAGEHYGRRAFPGVLPGPLNYTCTRNCPSTCRSARTHAHIYTRTHARAPTHTAHHAQPTCTQSPPCLPVRFAVESPRSKV